MSISKQIIMALHDYRKRNNRKPDEIRISNKTLDSLVAEIKATYAMYVEMDSDSDGYWFCGIKLVPDDRAKGIELIAKERFEVWPDEL